MSISPVLVWQRLLVERHAPRRIVIRLSLLYLLLLLPVAEATALGYWIESERPVLLPGLASVSLLVVFMLLRLLTFPLSGRDSRLAAFVWAGREFIPFFRQALFGLALAVSFVHPWAARAIGVVFLLWLALLLGCWAANRYYAIETSSEWFFYAREFFFPMPRMLAVYMSLPDWSDRNSSSSEGHRRGGRAAKRDRSSSKRGSADPQESD
jgi:hypothetical protein